jgi:hypothetical protein
VGLALDSQGRIFMSSDSTGEIYVVKQTQVNSSGTSTSGGTFVTSTSSSSGRSSSSNAAAAGGYVTSNGGWLLVGLTLTLSVVGGAFFVVG